MDASVPSRKTASFTSTRLSRLTLSQQAPVLLLIQFNSDGNITPSQTLPANFVDSLAP